ncbi:maleylpyruvate isomerase family mycothiol-dependent enzyme [Mycolicibacterium sp. P9-22]|nr:maleylpyruvate isomerase family mycothiol-dependent enzyme [Mycolicibacterium sp. P9-22]
MHPMAMHAGQHQTGFMRSELWANVHAERAALVKDLTGYGHLDWDTPSLCAGWDVRDVVVHLAATATLSLAKFARELVVAGFRPNRIAEKQIHAGRRSSPAQAIEALRSATYATASPPQPTITRVIEIVVHGEDIRRPLRIAHTYGTTHIADALSYLSRDHRFGAKTLIHGLQLRATDADIVIGQGETVEGPAVSLLVAASGRRAALEDLRGTGCQFLSQRMK